MISNQNTHTYNFYVTHRKNNFAEESQNLGIMDTDLKIILLDHQNNYVGNSPI